MGDKYALVWDDLSAAEKQALIHIDRLGTMPEETPECYECVNRLITALELVAYIPASQTLTPGKAFTLTEAGRALLPIAEKVTWEGLTGSQQNAMLMANNRPFFPFALSEIMACEWLAENGLLSDLDGEYLITEAGRALLPAGEAVDVQPERLAQEYVGARQKAWDMGAAFVDYKTWLEQRLAGVEVQRDDANERAAAAEALLGTFGVIWREWTAEKDQRMGFSDWLHQHLDENPYLVDKFKAVDEYISAVRTERLK